MSLNVTAILDALVSHAAALGHFERVNSHEPASAPGNGLTAAVWAQQIAPVPAASGLASTTVRVVFNLRLFTTMLQEPADVIDPNMLAAVDALMAAYSGDFELGGLVRNVDLLGQHGVPLSAQAGYVQIDGTLYRVMDLAVPLICNDVWSQGA